MSRAVTADHVLFDECIDAFRRERDGYRPYDKRESYSFLLTPFKIDEAWDLGKCQVSPSVEVTLPGAYSAFISKVKNPEWVDTHNSHLFGIALSTIISAVTLKPEMTIYVDFRNYQNTIYISLRLFILYWLLVQELITQGFLSLSKTK